MDAHNIYIKTVSSKGQFAIPKRLRAELGVNPGDKVQLTVTKNGCLTVTRIEKRGRRSGNCVPL